MRIVICVCPSLPSCVISDLGDIWRPSAQKQITCRYLIEPKRLRSARRLAHAVDFALDGMAHASRMQQRSRRVEVDVAKFEGDLHGVRSIAEGSGDHQRFEPEEVTAAMGAGHSAAADGGIKMMAALSLAAGGSTAAKRTIVEDVAASWDDTGVHPFRLGEARMGE